MSRRRQAVIAATPAPQERESSKLTLLAAAPTDALRARDVAETTARLAAETGVAVFRIAFERWVAGGDQRDLAQHIRELLDELATMTARPAPT